MTATTIAQVESIIRRQQARFLDHLRDTGQITPTLEADYCRSVKFLTKDICRAIKTPEAGSHEPARHETR